MVDLIATWADAVRRQKVAANRISFVNALRWLLDSKAGDELVPPKVNPDRSGRVEPRVRKRRPKGFPVMKKPRSVAQAIDGKYLCELT